MFIFQLYLVLLQFNMNIYKYITDGLSLKKIGYVLLWSGGLFAASFYTFCGKFNFAAMSDISALTMAKEYLFPLFMAMALFLLDAFHEINANNRQITPVYFACFLSFLHSTVFSILVNSVLFGWGFFIIAWVSLTILKASMLWDVKGVKINS